MGIFVLFDLWSETRLIKYEGIEVPTDRRPQFYNAKFWFKFYIDIDFENKCKDVLQFYNKKAWVNPVT